MSIGAGQLLWWDGLDLSHDIRVADGMAERQFGDRTGLIHKRTQNKPIGVVEDGLSLSGFFVANTTGQLIAEEAHKTGVYVSRGRTATRSARTSPSTANWSFRRAATSTTSAGSSTSRRRIVRRISTRCSVGSSTPRRTRTLVEPPPPPPPRAQGLTNYEAADLGASPGSIAPTLILHVGHITRGAGIASAHISLQHSTNNNTWASYNASAARHRHRG